MSPEEKKKLYDAIGYAGEDTTTTTYPDEVCLEILFRKQNYLLNYLFS